VLGSLGKARSSWLREVMSSLRKTLRKWYLTVAMKGWPAGATFDQTVTLDTVDERIEFSPFTRPDWRMTFDAAADTVALQTLDGHAVATLTPARASFKGHLRPTPWDALHLGYFLGYANWNYFTTPFLFSYPGVIATEIEPWYEAGQTWRRLRVRFPSSIATHNPEQVLYFDSTSLQRRMDYITEVLGPDRLATCLRHAIAEISSAPTRPDATAPTPASPNEPAAPNSPRKTLNHNNIRQRAPSDIRLTHLQS
jgi:hypothetical protein